MEIERVKYLLKSYLRSRIIKIEKQLIYLIEKDQAHLLSQSEMEYAWNLSEAKKEVYQKDFFNKISKTLNKMEENMPEHMSKYFCLFWPFLVPKPNSKQFVFVKFLVTMPKITILGHIDIQVKEDNIYFLPFD